MIKDTIVDGFGNAPHRSLYHALGLTKEETERPLIGIVSSYNEIVPGHTLVTKYGKIGGMVCFDSIYESVALDGVRCGAELLTVSTNDSWFDGSAAIRQHTAQAVLRAVECDRYVCRAGNTGFSCIISPTGEIISSIEPKTRGFAIGEVGMRSTRTLYSYIGNAFVYAAGIFAAVCVIANIIGDCKTKRMNRKADAENAENEVRDRDRHRDVGDEDGTV